jgi:hypothetical protein
MTQENPQPLSKNLLGLTAREQQALYGLATELPAPELEALELQPSILPGLTKSEHEQLFAGEPAPTVEPKPAPLIVVDAPPQWCLCEQPEGDWPKVRLCNSSDTLLEHIAGLEGQDVSICVFYGSFLRLTTLAKGRRYLILPGGKEAVVITKGEGFLRRTPVVLGEDGVEIDGVPVEFQLEGWMGDPAMCETEVGEFLQGNAEIRRARAKAQEKPKSLPKAEKPPAEDDGESETAPE